MKKNIKYCPCCGKLTNRVNLTLIDLYVSISPLCAKCHKDMLDWTSTAQGRNEFGRCILALLHPGSDNRRQPFF